MGIILRQYNLRYLFFILGIPILILLISAIGILQKKSRLLRLAIFCGVFGPLPGFTYAFYPKKPILNYFDSFIGYALGYLRWADPMFGPYCFIVGLLGGWVIFKTGRKPITFIFSLNKRRAGTVVTFQMPKWAQPVTIVVVAILATAPFILIDGYTSKSLGRDAIISSAFWGVFFLLVRKRFFGETQ